MIERNIERFGLRVKPSRDFDNVNPEADPRYRPYWSEYHRLTERRGVSVQYAKIEMRRRLTLIGAMMIHMGEADGMICGTFGTHALHLQYIDQVIGRRKGVRHYAAMNALVIRRILQLPPCLRSVHGAASAAQPLEFPPRLWRERTARVLDDQLFEQHSSLLDRIGPIQRAYRSNAPSSVSTNFDRSDGVGSSYAGT